MLKNNLEELKGLNTILKDEHTALQLAFGALEEKYRKTAVCRKRELLRTYKK